jgi:ABC-type transport system involved in multi-copper enzyme maturation permease subunit
MASSIGGFCLLAQAGARARLAARLVSDLGSSFPVIWTISAGILLGVLVVGLIYGVTAIISHRAGLLLEELVFDGLLKPVFAVLLVPSAVALALLYWAPWREMLSQLREVARVAFSPSQWSVVAPDADVLLMSAAMVLGLFLAGLALRLALPKVAAVAYTTAKEGLAQPLFWVLIALGAFMLLLFIWLPYSTFGEDIKMLKIVGLELLTPLAILLAVATASVSVAQEVEGRTALTVLSKPTGRRQFVVGKFLGVLIPVLVMFLILGLIYLGTVSYKTVYEGFENGRPDTSAIDCREEVVSIVPALVLRLMAAVVMAAISVAVSTRLPMLANFAICALVYVVGRLTPMVVEVSHGKNDIVQFMGQLIATVLPVLEWSNVEAGISGGHTVSMTYLFTSGLYYLLYCTFVLLGALVLFEDRDLA